MKQYFRILALLLALLIYSTLLRAQHSKIVQFLPENGLPSTTVYCCVQDQYGFMWFATTAGLTRFDGTTFRTFTVRDGLPDNEVLRIKKDSLGRMWIWCFNKSVCYYDPVKQKIVTEKEDTSIRRKAVTNFSGPKINLKGSIFPPEELKWINNCMYLPNDKGVYIFSKDTILIDSVLSGINVFSAYEDKEGNIWFTTNGQGVFCQLKNEVLLYDMADGLAAENIQSVYVNNEGDIYAGNDKNTIDLIRTGKMVKHITLRNNPNTQYCKVRRIDKISAYGILAITDRGAYLADKNPYVFNPVEKLAAFNKSFSLPPSSRYLLLGGSNILGLYDLKNDLLQELFPKRITALYSEQEGKYWFGSIDGLHYYDTSSPKGYRSFGTEYPYLSKTVSYITGSENSLIWVATNSYGIILLHNGKIVENISEKNGLASDICRKIFIDNTENNAWVATYKGLDKIHYKFQNNIFQLLSITHYTTAYGIADNEINDVYVRKRIIYAATAKGLSIFHDTNSNRTIPLLFTNVSVDNAEYKIQSVYKLGYKQNAISVSYAGICYSCGGKINYQFRLLSPDKKDTTWNYTTETTLEFAGLSPGNYTLQVRIVNGPNASLQFIIAKPFWQQWWFLSLIVLGFIGVVYFIYRERINSIRKEETKKTLINSQIAQLELKLLQAQLNPHFIFNSLNAIQFYINKMDKQMANDYLVKLSRLMRLFLDSSKELYSTIERETEIIKLYCQLEKLRFEDKFIFEIKISENLQPKAACFPSMLIQPFVENAINHGLVYKNKDGILIIAFDKTDKIISCTIEDNGIGRKASEQLKGSGNATKKSWGVNLSAERMDIINKMGDTDAKIEIKDKIDENGNACGTTVIITTRIITIKD